MKLGEGYKVLRFNQGAGEASWTMTISLSPPPRSFEAPIPRAPIRAPFPLLTMRGDKKGNGKNGKEIQQ